MLTVTFAHGKLQPVLHPAVTLAVIALIYFAAEPINRLLGKGGLSVVSRVMG